MVAAVIDVLRQLKEENLKPAYDTLFAFPIYEEIDHGGAYVPSEVSEYVALDIGLIGPDNHGSEKKVSIGASDNYSPYDWGLTTKIINLAKANNINYCVEYILSFWLRCYSGDSCWKQYYACCIWGWLYEFAWL